MGEVGGEHPSGRGRWGSIQVGEVGGEHPSGRGRWGSIQVGEVDGGMFSYGCGVLGVASSTV